MPSRRKRTSADTTDAPKGDPAVDPAAVSQHPDGWRPVTDPIIDLAAKHPALVVSGAIVLIAVVEIINTARGNVDTAVAIVQSVGAPTIVLGMIVASMPVLAAILAFYLFLTTSMLTLMGRRPLVTQYIALLATVLAVIVSPVVVLLGVAAAAALAVELYFRETRQAAKRGMRVALRDDRRVLVGPAAMAIIAGVPLLWGASGPWLPTEDVELGGDHVTVLVLDDEGPWMTLLRVADDTPMRVAANDVKARRLCTAHSVRWLTVPDLLGISQSQVPVCKDSRPP